MKGFFILLLALLVGGYDLFLLPDYAEDDRHPCTIRVKRGQDLRRILMNINGWEVVCLTRGIWDIDESVELIDSMKIRGVGPGRSVIKLHNGANISMWGPRANDWIMVYLEGLKIIGADPGSWGITTASYVVGQFTNIETKGLQRAMVLFSEANVSVMDSKLESFEGITVQSKSQLDIMDSEILSNLHGIAIITDHPTRHNIINTKIRSTGEIEDNIEYGVLAGGFYGDVLLEKSRIIGFDVGVRLNSDHTLL